MEKPSEARRRSLVFIEHISLQDRPLCIGPCSPEGNWANKYDKAWLRIPLVVTTVMSNSLSWRIHQAIRPDKAGLDKRYLDQMSNS